jgi:hypothetical protein
LLISGGDERHTATETKREQISLLLFWLLFGFFSGFILETNILLAGLQTRGEANTG